MIVADPRRAAALEALAADARQAVAGEEEACDRHHRALADRNAKIRALYTAMAQNDRGRVPSPTEIHKLTGLHPSTVRAVTREVREQLPIRRRRP